MIKSPFKFLDSYTREDRGIFFGRDREISELYRRVFESKILLVYGVSGTGKSSLINCGLASGFDDSDWLPVNVRRGSNIIESLNEAFNKQAISPLRKTCRSQESFSQYTSIILSLSISSSTSSKSCLFLVPLKKKQVS
jgi:AAA+ ATPase superfamily predicted ATPase